jgi:hypothetical protein
MSKKGKGKGTLYVIVTGAVMVIAVGLGLTLGLISTTAALAAFGVLVVGMLVMHGGGVSIASHISDHEGYQKTIEEDEQTQQEHEEWEQDYWDESHKQEDDISHDDYVEPEEDEEHH